MLTQDDLVQIKKVVELVVDIQLDPMREEIKKIKYLPTTEVFLGHMDAVYGELRKVREALEMQLGYRDRIEDHEERLVRLESGVES